MQRARYANIKEKADETKGIPGSYYRKSKDKGWGSWDRRMFWRWRKRGKRAPKRSSMRGGYLTQQPIKKKSDTGETLLKDFLTHLIRSLRWHTSVLLRTHNLKVCGGKTIRDGLSARYCSHVYLSFFLINQPFSTGELRPNFLVYLPISTPRHRGTSQPVHWSPAGCGPTYLIIGVSCAEGQYLRGKLFVCSTTARPPGLIPRRS